MVEVTEASSSHQVHPVALGLITTRQAPGDKEVRQVLLHYDTASMSPLLLLVALVMRKNFLVQ